MAYDQKTKDRAKKMFGQGTTVEEIADKLHINPDTIYRWKKTQNWDAVENAETANEIRKKLNKIVKAPGEVTEKQVRLIERMTKSLERVDKAAAKEDKSRKLKKKLIKEPASVDYIGTLRDRFLDKLYLYQREWVLDPARFRIMLKGRQTGLSRTIGGEVIINGMDERHENQNVVSASQDQADLVRAYTLWWLDELKVDYMEDKGDIVLPGGALCRYLPCNFRTVQGNFGDLYFDEFAWYIRPDRMYMVAVPIITVGKKRLSIVSSPYTVSDKFGEVYLDVERYPRFSRHSVDIYRAIKDGHNVDIAALRDLFDAETFALLYECKFFSDENSLFSAAEVKDAIEESCLGWADGWHYGGMDIGRYRDLTEIVLVQKLEKIVWTRHIETLIHKPYDDQLAAAIRNIEERKIKKYLVDRTGIGDNLAEKLLQKFPEKVEAVHFTREIKEEMALNIKMMFERRRIKIPNDRDLIAQLHAIKRTPTQTGFTYDSKRNEQIKHADRFWALALACRRLGDRERVIGADDVFF